MRDGGRRRRRRARSGTRRRARDRGHRRSPSCGRAACRPHSAPTARHCRWGWRRRPACTPRAWPPPAPVRRSPAAAYDAAFAPARWAQPDRDAPPAVRQNWIKAYPCCLQTHAAIEAAALLREDGRAARGLTVAVHPVSRRAAPYDEPADGLQAKFSIPYLAAFALLHGPPRAADFARVDGEARALAAERIDLRTDPSLDQSEARVESDGEVLTRVLEPLGSPGRPMDDSALRAKLHALAGDRLDRALDDPSRPAREVLAALPT